MIIDIALTCVGLYILLAGLFLIVRRDTVWNYQQRTGRGATSSSGVRDAAWDKRMLGIGGLGLIMGGVLLALAWLL